MHFIMNLTAVYRLHPKNCMSLDGFAVCWGPSLMRSYLLFVLLTTRKNLSDYLAVKKESEKVQAFLHTLFIYGCKDPIEKGLFDSTVYCILNKFDNKHIEI